MLDLLIDSMTEGKYPYAGLLNDGLFGRQIASIFDVNDSVQSGVILIISFIIGAVVLHVMSKNPEMKIRILLTVCCTLVIITGLQGYITLCVLGTVVILKAFIMVFGRFFR